MKKRVIKIGDVFEIKTKKGLAYIQYAYYDEEYKNLIRILDGFYSERPQSFLNIIKKEELYYTFVLLDIEEKTHRIEYICNMAVPNKFKSLPPFLINSPGDIRTMISNNWAVIKDGVTMELPEMTSDYININSKAITNIATIIQNYEIGWLPRYDIEKIGIIEWFKRFYPETIKIWGELTDVIENGNLKNIVNYIGKNSFQLVTFLEEKKISHEEFARYLAYCDYILTYYALGEINDKEFSSLLSEYRKCLKTLTRFSMGLTKKQPDFKKLQTIFDKMKNYSE